MQQGRTFRVFVSSTFEDLKAERNTLQDGVWHNGKLVKEGAFPRLRRLCEAHGARFQAIDLRWGVSQEASLDQQTMPLCLAEIARSQRVSPRPNFIVFLGQRYGWRPLPHEIPADELERILSAVGDPMDRDLLETWYRLDDNAMPPVCVLQPRAAPTSDAQTEEVHKAVLDAEEETWRKTEGRLRGVLTAALADLALPDERRASYLTSATEREIAVGAFQVEDAPQHVFCFFRTIEGLPEDESAAGFRDLDPRGEPDAEAADDLEDLKRRLTEHVPGNVFEYRAAWTGRGITDEHLEQLCNDVYHSLEAVILEELQAIASVEPLAQEIAAHEAFAEERTRHFRGRAAQLEAIARYLAATDRQPMAVWGESGTGKSTLLAQAIENARQAYPQREIVHRFTGATPASSNGRELLEGLCRQIGRAYGADEAEVPADYLELIGAFEQRLALATRDRPLILFLDALDQLREGDPARSLAWLPGTLPASVRLVVSTLPGDILASLETRVPAENRVELGPMRVQEAEDVLDLWMADARRTLREDQRREVLQKFKGCPRPLYLKLAFDEARRWRSYDAPEILSPDVPGIIGDLFARLSEDANHGGVMVERSLGYLAAARNGLSEDELLDLLSTDETVMADFRRRAPRSPPVARLPVVLWSRLFFDLEPYLTTRAADGTTLMAFYHPTSFSAAVDAKFLAGATRSERHRSLARYFAEQSLRVKHDGRSVANLRKLSELPYQQACGELRDEIRSTLLDFPFIAAKIECFGPQPLVEDYYTARKAIGADESLGLVRSALRLSAHVLAGDAAQTASQLTGRLLAAEPPEIRGLLEQIKKCHVQPWLRPITVGLTAGGGPLARTLVTGSGEVTALAGARDGRHAAVAGRTAVEVWDLVGGRCLHHLASQSEEVEAVVLTPDGSRVIAAAGTKIEIWDLNSGAPILSFDLPVSPPRRTNRVTGLAVAPDGRRLIVGHLTTLLVWDLERHDAVLILPIAKDSDYPACAVGISLDGSRAMSVGYSLLSAFKGSTDSGATPRLWDLVRGRELLHPMSRPGTLWGPRGYLAALSADGTAAAVADDRVLNLWDLRRWESGGAAPQEGRGVVEFVGRERCLALAMTPDGRRAVTGSREGGVELWDLDSGESLELGRHEGAVTHLAVSSDGGLALSGAKNGIVKVWDLLEVPQQRKSGGSGPHGFLCRGSSAWPQTIDRDVAINAVAVSSRGRRVVSASAEEAGGPTTLAITPSGDRIVTVACGSLRLWDLDGGAIRRASAKFALNEWEYSENPYRQIDEQEGLVASPMDNIMFEGSKVLRVWAAERPAEPLVLRGHERRINAVAIAPDGDKVVSASSDHTLKFWDLKNGDDLLTLTGHNGPVTAVAVAPDGRVISGSADGTLRLWEQSSGRSLAELHGHDAGISALKVTADARYAVSLSGERAPTFKVWSLSNGREEASLVTATGRISVFVLNGNGPSVVYASENDIYLWDPGSGAMKTFPAGHRTRITAFATIPGRRGLVSSAQDGSLIVWDLGRGASVARHSCEASVNACAVAPDGSTVVAGDSLGILHFLRIERLAKGV